MNGQIDWQAQRYHIWSAAWQGRGAPRLEKLSEHGQARASQHWSPEGKRSGERKRPIFHPPRSRTICVHPGKYWHCFEGNLRETAERRGGARKGLSERYDAILSWNWNWSCVITLWLEDLADPSQTWPLHVTGTLNNRETIKQASWSCSYRAARSSWCGQLTLRIETKQFISKESIVRFYFNSFSL